MATCKNCRKLFRKTEAHNIKHIQSHIPHPVYNDHAILVYVVPFQNYRVIGFRVVVSIHGIVEMAKIVRDINA